MPSPWRGYKLSWSDGSPLTVLATDGGLLAASQERPYVMLAPAERVEVWVDFARWSTGGDFALHSLEFDPGMSMRGLPLPDGARFPVLAFELRGGGAARATEPPRLLSQLPGAQAGIAVNADRPKVFDLTMGMMTWGVNGRSFEMLEASSEETVKLGTHEVWEFRNEDRRAMMGMLPATLDGRSLEFGAVRSAATAPHQIEPVSVHVSA